MFQIKMADLVICINNKYDYVETLCHDYCVESATSDMQIEASDEAI